jgi:hypothetical protein
MNGPKYDPNAIAHKRAIRGDLHMCNILRVCFGFSDFKMCDLKITILKRTI